MTLDHYDDASLIEAEWAGVKSSIARLAWREGLDPRDPDALDEEDQEKLERLRRWEP